MCPPHSCAYHGWLEWGGGEGPPVGAGLGQSVRKMSGMHVYLQGLAEVVEATLLA